MNLEGALTWAFEFEDQPYFAGFRALASNGINLPVFNVFRMFSRMGAERVAATSDGAADLDTMMKAGVRQKPDVAALASRDARRVTVLAWHYHDDDVAGPDAAVTLSLEGLGSEAGHRRSSSTSASTPRTATPTPRGSASVRPPRQRPRSTNSSRPRASWRGSDRRAGRRGGRRWPGLAPDRPAAAGGVAAGHRVVRWCARNERPDSGRVRSACHTIGRARYSVS